MLAALFARTAGKPVLVTQHIGIVPYRSVVLRMLMTLLNRLGAALVLKQASAVHFVSPHVKRYFASFVDLGTRARVTENGLDRTLFRRDQPEAPRAELKPQLLFVGRFVEKKGLRLIRAIAEQAPEWDFVLVGSGPLDPLKWQLKNVSVLGKRSQEELVGLYQRASVLILPSVGEGFPLVVQEALACGCVVAVSDEVASAGALPPEIALAASVEVGAEARWRSLLEAFMQEGENLKEARRAASAVHATQRWSWQTCVDAYEATIRSVTLRITPQRSAR
jgi:glycosyltransferase involved in cell wall biosynthesis